MSITFSNYPEFISALIQNITKDEKFSFASDLDWYKSTEKVHKYQRKFNLLYDGRVYYSIKTAPYFNCCGINNISEFNRNPNYYSSLNHKFSHIGIKLGTLFVFFICLHEYLTNTVGVINLTTPCENTNGDLADYYQKSYAVSKKLLKVLGGNEFQFKNPNTSHIIAHISLETERFKAIRERIGSNIYFQTEHYTEQKLAQNKKVMLQIMEQLEPLLNQLKSK